jgi:hypothetical protein
MGHIDFLVGRRLEEVRFGISVRLVFDLGDRSEPAMYANAEQPFLVRGPTEGAVPEKSAGLARLVAAVGEEVVRAGVAPEGTLSIEFSDGSEFECPPHPDFEAWQVVGGSPQYLVVCMPGGGEPAVWDSTHSPTPEEAEEAIEHLRELTGWPVERWELTGEGRIIINPSNDEPPHRAES